MIDVGTREAFIQAHLDDGKENWISPNNTKINKDSIIKNSNETAQKEFDNMVKNLKQNGISVHVFQDDDINYTPDSIFPNNWISFHENGDIGLYPMYAKNRRLERRPEVLEFLESEGFTISNIVDYSCLLYTSPSPRD